jgi:peptidyl-prolyl cis-trans isomerase A (cyclophilin A)
MNQKWLLLGVLAVAVGCSDESPSSDDDGSGGAGGQPGVGGSASGGMGGMGGTGGEAGKPSVRIATSLGDLVIELEPALMPITTENFLTYVDEGFYANTIIHRVIPDFVIQGGGFSSGFTAKSATHPPIQLETSAEVLHDYGAISMARTSDPNSATTQFFLVNAAAGAHGLDGQYAAFGRMLEGSNVLDAISTVPTETVGQYDDVPVDEVTVVSIAREP